LPSGDNKVTLTLTLNLKYGNENYKLAKTKTNKTGYFSERIKKIACQAPHKSRHGFWSVETC